MRVHIKVRLFSRIYFSNFVVQSNFIFILITCFKGRTLKTANIDFRQTWCSFNFSLLFWINNVIDEEFDNADFHITYDTLRANYFSWKMETFADRHEQCSALVMRVFTRNMNFRYNEFMATQLLNQTISLRSCFFWNAHFFRAFEYIKWTFRKMFHKSCANPMWYEFHD